MKSKVAAFVAIFSLTLAIKVGNILADGEVMNVDGGDVFYPTVSRLKRDLQDESVFLDRINTLIQRGDKDKAMELLRAMVALEKNKRVRTCSDLFSPDICAGNSADPFNLWAKLAAGDLTRDPSVDMTRRILAKMAVNMK